MKSIGNCKKIKKDRELKRINSIEQEDEYDEDIIEDDSYYEESIQDDVNYSVETEFWKVFNKI